MIEYILLPQTIDALGWTLIHSLWQGAVFAFILVLTLLILRGYSAKTRYVVSVGLLSAFLLTISVTFYQQWQEANIYHSMMYDNTGSNTYTIINTFQQGLTEENSAPITPSIDDETIQNLSISQQIHWSTTFIDYFNNHLPLLVTIWFLGVLFLQLRFLGRLAYVQRLKHYGTQFFPSSWTEKIEVLETKLRIQKQVVYRMSTRVKSPMVIGWLKPFVLVPQQIFNNLSETEIYAVLAHELAHIRREDFVVNLLQTFLCNTFFFHPGIWWMSHQIDEEREHCCDDLAVAALGGPETYAKTLINVSELQLRLQHNANLAMAFSGNAKRKKTGFSDRIMRLFNANESRGTLKERLATILILFSALFVGVAATERPNEEINDQISIEQESEVSSSNESINEKVSLRNIQEEPVLETIQTIVLDQLPVAKPVAPVLPISPSKPARVANQNMYEIENITQANRNSTRIDALIMACMEGDLEFAKILIASGIDINGLGSEGFTPLMTAVSNRKSKIVKFLIEEGADVNKVINGWNALIEAADEGSFKSMQYLLEAGADVNYYWTPGSPTAITMAASENHLNCTQLLLDNGADVNGIGESMPPLHIAAEEGNNKIIEYLLSQNVEVNKKDLFGRTALMYAAEEKNSKTFQLLLDAGANINTIDKEGFSAKDFAIEEDAYEILKFYGIEKSTDIHQAIRDGYIELVEEMVHAGQDVNERDDYGRTALHIAAALNHNIDMRVLIDLGADIDAKDKQDRTPMMYAAADGKSNAVVLLVSKLANVNIKDVDGMTAYDWAKSGNNPDLAKFLGLITNTDSSNAQNADHYKLREEQKKQTKEALKQVEKVIEKITDNFGEEKGNKSRETFHINDKSQHLKQYNIRELDTKLFDIVNSGTIQDLDDFLKVEQNLNITDDTGQTALMSAARNNRLEMAKILIANGAEVNLSSYSGLTALHYAALENRAAMAKLLLNNNALVDPTMRYSSTDGNYSKEALVYQYIGATPLLIATESNNTEVVKILLKAGANPNHLLTKKEYRLHKDRLNYLDAQEVMGIDEEFLKHVDIKVTDESWTPLKQARLLNKQEILSLYQTN